MTTLPQTRTEASNDPAFPFTERVPLKTKIVNLIAVVLPFAGLVAAVTLLWGVAFDWVYLAILAVMYGLTAVGVTVGYHRLFTHRSFKAPKPVAATLAILGSMAVEGPLIRWVGTHRRHHQHSDDEHDPHSPHGHGAGVWNTLRGMWHAHVGWIFLPDAEGMRRYTADLWRDKVIRVMSKLFLLWVALGLIIPAAMGGLLTLSWTGVLLGFLWGGLVRVFLVHHVTWSVNSVCHVWGSRPFKSHDESRNNAIFGVLALGEGWHNNHHAFPTSARHGLRWWEFDASYWVIRGMERVGLASDVRVPKPERVVAKRTQLEAAARKRHSSGG